MYDRNFQNFLAFWRALGQRIYCVDTREMTPRMVAITRSAELCDTSNLSEISRKGHVPQEHQRFLLDGCAWHASKFDGGIIHDRFVQEVNTFGSFPLFKITWRPTLPFKLMGHTSTCGKKEEMQKSDGKQCGIYLLLAPLSSSKSITSSH